MRRGFQTSEFWMILAVMVHAAVMMLTGQLEAKIVEGVMVVPDNVWALFGESIAAGLYAISRGLTKGLEMRGGTS